MTASGAYCKSVNKQSDITSIFVVEEKNTSCYLKSLQVFFSSVTSVSRLKAYRSDLVIECELCINVH